MYQYDFNKAKYGTHSLVAAELGENKIILDVGCNKGYLRKLAQKNEFWGIDFDDGDLEIARKQNGYREVFKLDLNDYAKLKIEKKFDVLVFADILEHLTHPHEVLKYFIDNHLQESGQVVVSLPNVANFFVRFNLLFGNFNYTESGILDRTHLHLYTSATARILLRSCGLKIIKKKYSSNNFGGMIKFAPFLGSLFGYNLIFVCQKKS